MPYSSKKKTRRAEVLYQRALLRLKQHKIVNQDVMIKRKEIVRIDHDKNIMTQCVKEKIAKAQQKWGKMKIKGKEFRKKDLFDFYNFELQNEVDIQKKTSI